jgi:trigger factor
MLGWATVQRHVADEMTLLCDKHQRERTNGLLPISDVQAANQDPFNRRSGSSAPYTLHYSGDYCRVDIGSNVLTAPMMSDLVAVQVDGEPLVGFRFEDSHYLLNVLLFNEVNEPVLQIVDNELIYSAEPWDIELVGTRLTVRAAARKIFIDIVFEPPATVRFLRGRLLLNGIELYIQPTFILVVNSGALISRSKASGSSIGLNVGYDGGPSAFRIGRVPRYEIDRRAVLRQAKKEVKEQDWDLGDLNQA